MLSDGCLLDVFFSREEGPVSTGASATALALATCHMGG